MPTLPWTALARIASDEYVVVATRFDLSSRPHIGRIFSAAGVLISTFNSTPGLIGYSLRTSILDGSLWTLSAWSTESEMRQFVRGSAHGMTVNTTARWMRTSSFVTWVESGDAVAPSWQKATRLMRSAPIREAR